MTELAKILPDQAAGHAPVALAFLSDHDSEGIVRQALDDIGIAAAQMEIASGDIRAATMALARRGSPRLLIVDIHGLDEPGRLLSELAKVCEPSTGVVVVGDHNDIRLYRELKRVGVNEYFFKPLVRNLIVQACNSILHGDAVQPGVRAGRLVFILGVRGGVGATTIAVSTAWEIAQTHKRWAMLLDLDVYGGDAALQLDAVPSHALTEALARPERVDDLFLERATTHVTPRLDLLASLEPLSEEMAVVEANVLSLINALLHRYRFVLVDLPAPVAAKLTQVLHLPSLCILVSNGTLVAARDTARWREQIGPNSSDRSTLHVLNQSGLPGSLPMAEFVRVAGAAPDVVVPHLREIESASKLGIKGIQSSAAFHRALEPMFRQLTGEGREPHQSLLARLFG